jgi:hypothetical protein
VATFTDPGGAEALDGTHYTASINWGDQTTATAGSITVSNGTFTISGSHTYISSGNFTITTSINHETILTTVKSSASVGTTPALVVSAPSSQTSSEGSLANFTLGSFTDTGGSGPWLATVSWGDGTTDSSFSPGAPGPLGTLMHTYSEEGPYTVTVTVQDTGDGMSGSAPFQVAVSDPAVLGTPVAVSATAGSGFTAPVATFTDPGGAEALDGMHYTASINWGDQTTATTGSITVSNGTFTISGSHTYASSGNFTITTSINHEGVITPVATSATVGGSSSAPVVSGPGNQTSVEGATTSFSLGSFSDSGNGPWTVLVGWGDGTSHTNFNPTATGPLGSQSHTYAEEGTYTVILTVQDTGDGLSGSATFQVTVSDPAVLGTPVAVNATAGAAFSGAVATFTDPGGAEANDGTHYTASINWGDQTTATTGSITVSGGAFTISGSHTYASSGNFTITTSINHEGVFTSVTSAATVSTAATLNDGTILVVSSPSSSQSSAPTGIIGIDPSTDQQFAVSTGGLFVLPDRITEGNHELLYVADLKASKTGAVIEYDPSTGKQLQVATGTYINAPDAIIFTNGHLYVADLGNGSNTPANVVEITPSNGKQRLVLGGGSLGIPVGLAVGPGNSIYVLDAAGSGTIFQIDIGSGRQSVVAKGFSAPVDLAEDSNGNLYVINQGDSTNPHGSVVEVNPQTGAQTVLALRHLPGTAATTGVVDQNGTIYVGAMTVGDTLGQVVSLDQTDTQNQLTQGNDLDLVKGITIFHTSGGGAALAPDGSSAASLVLGPLQSTTVSLVPVTGASSSSSAAALSQTVPVQTSAQPFSPSIESTFGDGSTQAALSSAAIDSVFAALGKDSSQGVLQGSAF